MTLTIVYDNASEGHSIYIDDKLRGDWREGELTPKELVDSWFWFAGVPVSMQLLEIYSVERGLLNDDDGSVNWPETLSELNLRNVV